MFAYLCFSQALFARKVLFAFQYYYLYRQDRDPGKRRGGGVCFIINLSWAIDICVLKTHCLPLLELLAIRIRPFFLPRELISVHLTVVHIPCKTIRPLLYPIYSETATNTSTALLLVRQNTAQLYSSLHTDRKSNRTNRFVLHRVLHKKN